ncbi:hypothetical protein E4U57_006545 [Claviceps arundinis]|uniref:Uncharacterized protein n=1 Tax=Claviceps arundinis TaxID=1623583 RepID=A0ABQ7PIG1_9HYPO|nr:hypothetical protein E4U57_006545 [Claviceps arundinis]
MHLLLPSPPFSPENQAVPWAAPDPEAGSAVTCERCHSTIISDGKLRVWKDLPSENWAEMMEFWHYHKPHDRDRQEHQALSDKEYGANNNVVSAQSGVDFLDIMTFIFDERGYNNLCDECVQIGFKALLWSGHRYNSRIVTLLSPIVEGT